MFCVIEFSENVNGRAPQRISSRRNLSAEEAGWVGSDVFDIARVYSGALQGDLLDASLALPPKHEKVTINYECTDCEGEGEVTISDWVGKNYYEVEVDCQGCDGAGFIEDGDDECAGEATHTTEVEPVLLEYRGNKGTMLYNSACTIFMLQGKACTYLPSGVAFAQADVDDASQLPHPQGVGLEET